MLHERNTRGGERTDDGDGRSIDERTLVYFAQNDEALLRAYVENGEGRDRAGGFAIQVRALLAYSPYVSASHLTADTDTDTTIFGV